jgi:hypothetical protein
MMRASGSSLSLRERIDRAASWDELLTIADHVASQDHPRGEDLEFNDVCQLIERLRRLRAVRERAIHV